MSIFNPGNVLYDVPPRPTVTTSEAAREEHKILRRTQRLRELVERLDEIVRKSRP